MPPELSVPVMARAQRKQDAKAHEFDKMGKLAHYMVGAVLIDSKRAPKAAEHADDRAAFLRRGRLRNHTSREYKKDKERREQKQNKPRPVFFPMFLNSVHNYTLSSLFILMNLLFYVKAVNLQGFYLPKGRESMYKS